MTSVTVSARKRKPGKQALLPKRKPGIASILPNVDRASEVNEELAKQVTALAKVLNADGDDAKIWQPGEVNAYWDFQGDAFADLDDAFVEMTTPGTTERRAEQIAAKLAKRIATRIASYRKSLPKVVADKTRARKIAKAERELEQGELRRLALEQLPDLAEKDFIIVGNGVLCGEADDEDHVTNGHTEPPKKSDRRNFDYDPKGAEDKKIKDQLDDWRDPVDLFGQFLPPELPRGLLPKLIEDFAFINAEMKGADAGGFAAAALAACGAAIPDSIELQMKVHDHDWRERPCIWVGLIGLPSTKKTPIIKAASQEIVRIDTQWINEFQADKGDYDNASKEDQANMVKPVMRRLRIEDTTIEKAMEIAAYNPNGLFLKLDEMAAWFGGMEKYSGARGANKDRAGWLQAFNGGPYAIDRLNRGTIPVSNWSVSMLGGIQPDVIRTVASYANDDGFLQRMFPIVLREGAPDKDEKAPPIAMTYARLIEKLTELKPPTPRIWDTITDEHGALRFSPEAQALRNALSSKHHELMQLEAINRKLAGHIGKYDGLFGRLCIIWHCIENVDALELPGIITLDTARHVADFMELFFLPHAVAFFCGTLGLSDRHEKLTAVAGYILAKGKTVMTPRDVQRGDGTMRDLGRSEIDDVFAQLTHLGWIDWAKDKKGNPLGHYAVNPKLHILFADRAKQQRKHRDAARALILSKVVAKQD